MIGCNETLSVCVGALATSFISLVTAIVAYIRVNNKNDSTNTK